MDRFRPNAYSGFRLLGSRLALAGALAVTGVFPLPGCFRPYETPPARPSPASVSNAPQVASSSPSFSTDPAVLGPLTQTEDGFRMTRKEIDAAIQTARAYEVRIENPCGPFAQHIEQLNISVDSRPERYTFVPRPKAGYSLTVTLGGSMGIFGTQEIVQYPRTEERPKYAPGSLSPDAMGLERPPGENAAQALHTLHEGLPRVGEVPIGGGATMKRETDRDGEGVGLSVPLYPTTGPLPRIVQPDVNLKGLEKSTRTCSGDSSTAGYHRMTILEIPYTSPNGAEKYFIVRATPMGIQVFGKMDNGVWGHFGFRIEGEWHDFLPKFGNMEDSKPLVLVRKEGDVFWIGLYSPQTGKARLVGLSPKDNQIKTRMLDGKPEDNIVTIEP